LHFTFAIEDQPFGCEMGVCIRKPMFPRRKTPRRADGLRTII
jgi:hypothetical protein